MLSGAYFGDKMSPLSDTTNLAPAMAGTDIYTHIRHMTYTSGVAFGLTLRDRDRARPLLRRRRGEPGRECEEIIATLERDFAVGPWHIIPAILVIVCAYKK